MIPRHIDAYDFQQRLAMEFAENSLKWLRMRLTTSVPRRRGHLTREFKQALKYSEAAVEQALKEKREQAKPQMLNLPKATFDFEVGADRWQVLWDHSFGGPYRAEVWKCTDAKILCHAGSASGLPSATESAKLVAIGVQKLRRYLKDGTSFREPLVAPVP